MSGFLICKYVQVVDMIEGPVQIKILKFTCAKNKYCVCFNFDWAFNHVNDLYVSP
jgi:hypothetical protein